MNTQDIFKVLLNQIASKFNVEAQIIGRVESSLEKRLTIKSEYGTFDY